MLSLPAEQKPCGGNCAGFREFQYAGTDGHSSTKFFAVWKSSQDFFEALCNQHPGKIFCQVLDLSLPRARCNLPGRERLRVVSPADGNIPAGDDDHHRGAGAAAGVCPPRMLSFILVVCLSHIYPTDSGAGNFSMPKRTFQPNRRHRSKTHGFRTRMKTKSGRAVISRRRAKGRKRVSVKPGFRE